MKVTMPTDLGTWVQPKPSESGDRGYQGSRRRASPSYLRRQERRAAERAAASAGPATAPAKPAAAAAQAPAPGPKPGRTCSKCNKPCLGHKGPTGEKCSFLQPTPEKVRDSSLSTSLLVTPVRETRAEECQNCGAEMSPVHQCDETENVSEPETVPECVKMCPHTHKDPCDDEDPLWCYDIYTRCWCDKNCEAPCDEEKKCNCHNENCLLFRKCY